MANKYLCTVCQKSFYKDFLENINDSQLICCLCKLRIDATDEINCLKNKLETERLSRSADKDAFALEIFQLKEEVRLFKDVNSIAVKAISPKSYTDAVNTSPKSNFKHKVNFPQSTNNSFNSPKPSDEDFTPVKNGLKPHKHQFHSIPIKNSFSPLSRNEEEVPDTVLVGDSMFRHQDQHFGVLKPKSRIHSYGGFSLSGPKKLLTKINESTASTSSETLFIVEVGTNDLLSYEHKQSSTPNDLVEKYRSLLHHLREKSGSKNICILGLLPAIFESYNDIWDRKHINELLERLAYEEDVHYLSLWKEFAHSPDYVKLFNRGGIHLSREGNTLLGQQLSDYVANFHQKCIPLLAS